MSKEFTILGYSERGAVNALFYDIAHSETPLRLLKEFLELAGFSVAEKLGGELTSAEVMIEQSLSDFGDADVVLLLEAGQAKSVVYIEAKVKSFQTKSWTLDRELEKFKKGLESQHELSSSNLFTQLFHKCRLNECLNMEDGIARLENGIEFPSCSTKGLRKIGKNVIVKKAVDKIRPYADNGWYLALVPDEQDVVRKFFKEWKASSDSQVMGGDPVFRTKLFGLAWEQVETFSSENNLMHLNAVLRFNEEQIYRKAKPSP